MNRTPPQLVLLAAVVALGAGSVAAVVAIRVLRSVLGG
jgi:hypothetical protein